MDYAITYTINPHYYKMLPEEQYDVGVNMIKALFADYKLTIIAEFTKAFNVHFHGIIYSKTKRELYDLIRKNKILGFINVKPIENWEDWVMYITKNTIQTYKDFKCRHPVPINDYQIRFKLLEENFEEEEP